MDLAVRRQLEKLSGDVSRLDFLMSTVGRTSYRTGIQDYRIIRGKVTHERVPSDPDFTLDNVKALTQWGMDPRIDQGSTYAKVIVANVLEATLHVGTEVFAIYSHAVAKVEDWGTGQDIKEGDVRRAQPPSGLQIYQSLEDHTSGTFTTDLGAGKWEAIRPDETINWIPLAIGASGVGLVAFGVSAETIPSPTISGLATDIPPTWSLDGNGGGDAYILESDDAGVMTPMAPPVGSSWADVKITVYNLNPNCAIPANSLLLLISDRAITQTSEDNGSVYAQWLDRDIVEDIQFNDTSKKFELARCGGVWSEWSSTNEC